MAALRVDALVQAAASMEVLTRIPPFPCDRPCTGAEDRTAAETAKVRLPALPSEDARAKGGGGEEVPTRWRLVRSWR